MRKCSWDINMKTLLDHMIKDSGEERKFVLLPEMCYNSPVKLGTLTSESFSENMMSASDLLVDAHRLDLDYYMVDKLIALHMNKRFMDRVRIKFFSSIMFENVESINRVTV